MCPSIRMSFGSFFRISDKRCRTARDSCDSSALPDAKSSLSSMWITMPLLSSSNLTDFLILRSATKPFSSSFKRSFGVSLFVISVFSRPTIVPLLPKTSPSAALIFLYFIISMFDIAYKIMKRPSSRVIRSA